MIKTAFALSLCLLAKAQELQQPVSKLVHVHYGNANAMAEMVRRTGVSVGSDNDMHVIVLNGLPGQVKAAEDIISEIDRAPASAANDLDVTVYLIAASPAGAGSVPRGLDGVIRQLKTAFPYEGYRLLDTVVMRSRVGDQSKIESQLSGLDSSDTKPVKYAVEFILRRITPDRRASIDRFSLSVYTNGVSSILTSFDIQEGQKVVVGKTNGGSSATPIFAVVSTAIVSPEGSSKQ